MEEKDESGDFFEEDGIYEAVEDGKSEIVAEAERLRQKLRRVLKETADGREVADYIIRELCGFDRSCFSRNALEMAREAGKREVGLVLTQVLDWTPEAEKKTPAKKGFWARAFRLFRRKSAED